MDGGTCMDGPLLHHACLHVTVLHRNTAHLDKYIAPGIRGHIGRDYGRMDQLAMSH